MDFSINIQLYFSHLSVRVSFFSQYLLLFWQHYLTLSCKRSCCPFFSYFSFTWKDKVDLFTSVFVIAFGQRSYMYLPRLVTVSLITFFMNISFTGLQWFKLIFILYLCRVFKYNIFPCGVTWNILIYDDICL